MGETRTECTMSRDVPRTRGSSLDHVSLFKSGEASALVVEEFAVVSSSKS